MPYYTNRVSSYVEGKIQQVGNEEYETILGHSIPDGSWSGELGMNDALCQMYYAKSGIARFICKKLGEKLKKERGSGNSGSEHLVPVQHAIPCNRQDDRRHGFHGNGRGTSEGCKRPFQRTWKSNQRIFQKPEAEQAVRERSGRAKIGGVSLWEKSNS